MKRSRGLRSGSRYKLSRRARERGLSPITRTLEQFGVGERVNIVIDPFGSARAPSSPFPRTDWECYWNAGQGLRRAR